MIQIPQPAMAINTEDAFYPYQMWNTRRVYANVTPHWLIENIFSVAANAPDGWLAALVFCCHGFVDKKGHFSGLDVGTGIYFSDLKLFRRLRDVVDKIYISACKAGSANGGHRFCREFAKQTGAIVYAADGNQITYAADIGRMRPGIIDNFEGQLYRFGYDGDIRPVDMVSQ